MLSTIMETMKDNWPEVDDYICFAETLKLQTHNLICVQGASKLERKIDAEIRFLHSLKQRPVKVQKTHLKSNNLSHFSGIIDAAQLLPGVTQVLAPFKVPSKKDSLVIDLVAGNGHIWVKVIARKAQALHLVWTGQGQYGERDLLSQASEYLQCADNHLYDFSTPQVYFAFYNGVTLPMAEALNDLGVRILGQILPSSLNVMAKLDDGDNRSDTRLNSGLGDGKKIDPSEEHIFQSSGCLSQEMTHATAKQNFNLQYKKEKVWKERSETNENFCDSPELDKHQNIDISVIETQIFQKEMKTLDSTLSHTAHHISRSQSESLQVLPNPDQSFDGNLRSKDKSDGGLSRLEKCDGGRSRLKDKSDDGLLRFTDQSDGGLLRCTGSNQSINLMTSRHNLKHLFLHLVSSPPAYDQNLLKILNDYQTQSIRRVNMDITTLIALVSSVSNGSCHLIFQDKILTHQAKEERESPVLPMIQKYLTGKEIFVCQTAWSSFQSIISTLGGPLERKRASDLLASVNLIEDQPSERTLAMKCCGRIKARSKVIFGTGDALKAVTLTSNMGFVRAAKSQGFVYSVFLHPARALTEEKEKTAAYL